MEDDGPPGVPEWVVTYGDMMSLLLTFFIMLVSLSEVVADKKYRAVLQSIQQYVGYRTNPVSPPGKNFPMNSLAEQLHELRLDSFSDDDNGRGGIKTRAVRGSDMRVFRTREGNAQSAGPAIAFDPGQAALSDSAQTRLSEIAKALAGKPNKVEIRAHAALEALPSESPFPDKLALTYHRAKAVMGFLADQGIDSKRMRITAASDIEPATNDERQLQSDHAEVRITDAFVGEYVGPRDSPD